MAERRVPLFVTAPADGKPRRIVLQVLAQDDMRSVTAAFAAPRELRSRNLAGIVGKHAIIPASV
jgi:hypothetical protein